MTLAPHSLSVDRSFETFSVAFAALYLPGGPRPFCANRRSWRYVEHLLRSSGVDLDHLSRQGLAKESLLLSDDALVEWAHDQVHQRSCLTVFSGEYPRRWAYRLGSAAPPAIWIRGNLPPSSCVAVVGGRNPSKKASQFAWNVARHSVSLGYSVVSGGAIGCDTAARKGSLAGFDGLLQINGQEDVGCSSEGEYPAPHVIILPRGLSLEDRLPGVCYLSVQEPGSGFSTPAAMERNALIYAFADHAVVCEARFREGGTWLGATDALRRKLTRVYVRQDPTRKSFDAMVSLGAIPLTDADVLQCDSLKEVFSRPDRFQAQSSLPLDGVA